KYTLFPACIPPIPLEARLDLLLLDKLNLELNIGSDKEDLAHRNKVYLSAKKVFAKMVQHKVNMPKSAILASHYIVFTHGVRKAYNICMRASAKKSDTYKELNQMIVQTISKGLIRSFL
ncbi:MAG: hypothetical protein P8J32_02020, partial [bacterium]|nr:hypothetical protein [bacterium]